MAPPSYLPIRSCALKKKFTCRFKVPNPTHNPVSTPVFNFDFKMCKLLYNWPFLSNILSLAGLRIRIRCFRPDPDHKIDGKFSRQRCLDPVFKKCMDPDPVCPERLDPDPDPVCPERLDPDPEPFLCSNILSKCRSHLKMHVTFHFKIFQLLIVNKL